MKRLKNIGNKSIPVVFILLILSLLEYLVDSGIIKAFIFPAPSDIGKALIKYAPSIFPHVLSTLYVSLIGLVLGLVVAFVLAILMENVSLVHKAIYPLLIISQNIPIIAIAPLIVLILGFGVAPKIFCVALACFFPVVINLLEGFKSVDLDLINLIRSMGGRKMYILMTVKIPWAIFNLFSGLKIAATYCIATAVIAEWLGGEKGIGVYIMTAKRSYLYNRMYAVIIITALLGIVLVNLISLLQKLTISWKQETK